MADESTPPPLPAPPVVVERTANFVSTYANSAIIEGTAWDLKVTFGQIDQVAGQPLIKQHLAVSIPWAQAKLAVYWLQVQIIAHELDLGKKIAIRPDTVPSVPLPLTPEQQSNPIMHKYIEAVTKLREEFIASLV
jgi:hypothetical protein